jgi:hypothetical protein
VLESSNPETALILGSNDGRRLGGSERVLKYRGVGAKAGGAGRALPVEWGLGISCEGLAWLVMAIGPNGCGFVAAKIVLSFQ